MGLTFEPLVHLIFGKKWGNQRKPGVTKTLLFIHNECHPWGTLKKKCLFSPFFLFTCVSKVKMVSQSKLTGKGTGPLTIKGRWECVINYRHMNSYCLVGHLLEVSENTVKRWVPSSSRRTARSCELPFGRSGTLSRTPSCGRTSETCLRGSQSV